MNSPDPTRWQPRLACLFLIAALGAGFTLPAAGQPAQPVPAPLNPIEQLAAPIALYPDPLVSLILPASTVPADIAAAAQYLRGLGDPLQVDVQPWDASVRALAHYPAVLEWMADNPAWTAALGAAFANTPIDVMNAIQHLRVVARAAGTLASTPEQDVVNEDGIVAILPADPEMIYVPTYDPDVVYVTSPYPAYTGPFLTFGVGFAVGAWLGFECDWQHHALVYGDWRNWHDARGWGQALHPGQPGYVYSQNSGRWRPSHFPVPSNFASTQPTAPRPHAMPGALPPPEPRHAPRVAADPPPASHRLSWTFGTAPRAGGLPPGSSPSRPGFAPARAKAPPAVSSRPPPPPSSDKKPPN